MKRVLFVLCAVGIACDVGENSLGNERGSASGDGDGGNAGSTSAAGGATGSEDTTGSGSGTCDPGDMRMADDGCNTCECTDEGRWACTEEACEPCADGDVMPGVGGCLCTCVGSQWDCPESCDMCAPGEMMDAGDGCNTCTCESDGQWVCTTEACVEPGDPFAGPEVVACAMTTPFDALTVLEATIEGDMLMLQVEYSGGCAMHLLGGCWDGAWAESDPLQTGVQIAHDDMDDACDGIENSMLALDLRAIAEAHAVAYGAGGGDIRISLTGWPELLPYSF